MDVQFLGYGVFIAVIIGLIMGFPSWQIRLVEAIIVVASGVLTEHEACLLYTSIAPCYSLYYFV